MPKNVPGTLRGRRSTLLGKTSDMRRTKSDVGAMGSVARTPSERSEASAQSAPTGMA